MSFSKFVLIILLVISSQSFANFESDLLQKAKDEGTLVVLTNQLPYGEILIEGFKKKYPGIKVKQNQFDLYDNDILAQLMTENETERVDVMFGCQSEEFVVLSSYDLIANLSELENWPTRPEFLTDTEKHIHLVATPHILVYNSKKVSKKDLPEKYEDLLDSKWKNKIALRHPNYGNSPAFMAHYMMLTRGNLDWYAKLGKNKPVVAKYAGEIYTRLNNGESVIALGRDVDVVNLVNKNKDLKIHYLNEIPYQYQFAILNKKSVRTSAAKLLLNWVMKEGLEELEKAGYTAGKKRTDLAANSKIYRIDFNTISTRTHIEVKNAATDKLKNNGAKFILEKK